MAHWQWHDLYKHSTSSFLFSSPDAKVPSTARKVHIRRLCDILHLSIQRGDLPRARRAFALLARCEEIEWMTIWKIGLLLLTHDSASGGGDDALRVCAEEKHIDFLRVMMLQHPEQRESLVQELVLSLALAGWERDALDELELYLPSLPYQDNPVLHTYAGLICLRLAQWNNKLSGDTQEQRSDQAMLREARQYLERARALDPEVVPPAFIRKLATLAPEDDIVGNESDDDMMGVDSKGQGRKRIRM